jgi:hypothetical protein
MVDELWRCERMIVYTATERLKISILKLMQGAERCCDGHHMDGAWGIVAGAFTDTDH